MKQLHCIQFFFRVHFFYMAEDLRIYVWSFYFVLKLHALFITSNSPLYYILRCYNYLLFDTWTKFSMNEYNQRFFFFIRFRRKCINFSFYFFGVGLRKNWYKCFIGEFRYDYWILRSSSSLMMVIWIMGDFNRFYRVLINFLIFGCWHPK